MRLLSSSPRLIWHSNIVFIGIPMTLDTILEVTNAFLNVFATNFFNRMFMASIAGVAAIVVANMARNALRIMITVKFEILVMIKGGRRPFFL